MVELVDRAGTGPQTRDVDLERAVEGLARRERLAVDLHYFVGLDLATVAEVVRGAPATVEATLHQARERLRLLVGDDDRGPDGPAALRRGRRWQDEQPPPPEVPLAAARRDPPAAASPGAAPWSRAAAVLLVVGGAVAVVERPEHGDGDSPPAAADTVTRRPASTAR